MKERIRSVMQYAKLSQQDFAARIGVSPATLSGIFSGRVNSADKYVNAIHQAFPEVNVNWLLFGEGEMLNDEDGSAPAGADGHPTADLLDEAAFTSGKFSHDDIRKAAAQMKGVVAQATPAQIAAAEAMQARLKAQAARASHGLSGMGINIDKPSRKIKEIRVFFDDGTFEVFVPSSK